MVEDGFFSIAFMFSTIYLRLEKRPPKSLKNEMLIFGLHSTSDDWPSDPGDEI